ncbi:MAG: hypothetical protein KKG75_03400 [Nanoarchaeota archaeon]|nr:hypothetical protein [Nanoarchaeota archaeon]
MKRGILLALVFLLFSTTSLAMGSSFGPELSLNMPTNQLFLLAFGLLIAMMISAIFLEKNVSAISTKTGPAIGTALLGLSSSLPLIVFALTAALAGELDIAINSIIGTNVANLTLVLGTLAILKPLNSGKNVAKGIIALIIILLAISLIFFTVNPFSQSLAQSSTSGRIIDHNESFILLGLFVFFILLLQFFSTEHSNYSPAKEKNTTLALILILFFGILVCWFANQSVLAFIKIANIFSIPSFIISSVLVVIGTSLPEFAIGLVVLSHREEENIFTNLITSDIINFVFCLALISFFVTLHFNNFILGFQIPFMLLTILVSIKFLHSAPKSITRKEGFILIILFALYLFLMSIGFFIIIP